MLTQERLKELFHYNPKTGLFIRLVPIKRTMAGDVAGCPNSDGYLRIGIDRSSYLAHRLAWFYTHEVWPKTIDHINGKTSDNRIKNLRSVPHIENHKNRKFPKNNTSGVMGVYWYEPTNAWVASISVKGNRKFLGSFKYKWDAICARKSVESKYGYHKNHGRNYH